MVFRSEFDTDSPEDAGIIDLIRRETTPIAQRYGSIVERPAVGIVSWNHLERILRVNDGFVDSLNGINK